MRQWIVRIIVFIVVVVILAGAIFAITWSNPYPAGTAAAGAMQSDPMVSVTDKSDQIVFMPAHTPKVGFVFYPGARVAPVAYAGLMHAIAAQGYAVFVIKMPLNFAILGINRADDVMAANPTIKTWAVGGHSLGGAMACTYAASGKAKGLILYAAYPGGGTNLFQSNLAVVSIYGTNDGLATVDKVDTAKPLLPASTKYVAIQGGIHSFFGDYGLQDGDGTPGISREDAAAQIVAASVALLDQISG